MVILTSHGAFIGKPQKAELPDFMEKADNANVRNFTYQGFDDFSKPVEAVAVNTQPEIEIIAPTSPAIFTVEDMELAKTLAREEGLQQGLAKAEQDFAEGKAAAEIEEEVRIADLLERISFEVATLNGKAVEANKRLVEEISGVAVTIAKKVCGEIALKSIEDEVALIINDLSGKLEDGEVVKIYLHPENIAVLNGKFTNASLNVDDKVAVGDFRVEWKNGFAEKNLKKLWKTIEEICSRKSSIENEVNINEGQNG